MAAGEARGLLTIWADIDPEYEQEFLQWHNCEHMHERVSHPGFRCGRRYHVIGEGLRYFIYYELDNAAVAVSEAYMRSQNNPTPWTQKSVAHFRGTQRTVYRLLASAGQEPPTDAPYVLAVRFNPPAPAAEASPHRGPREEGTEEVIRWYREEHLPCLTAVPGVRRGRLLDADMAISQIQTKEKNSDPGRQRFLALYEVNSADVPSSKSWMDAARGTEWSVRMLGSLQSFTWNLYWLHFSLWPPRR